MWASYLGYLFSALALIAAVVTVCLSAFSNSRRLHLRAQVVTAILSLVGIAFQAVSPTTPAAFIAIATGFWLVALVFAIREYHRPPAATA